MALQVTLAIWQSVYQGMFFQYILFSWQFVGFLQYQVHCYTGPEIFPTLFLSFGCGYDNGFQWWIVSSLHCSCFCTVLHFKCRGRRSCIDNGLLVVKIWIMPKAWKCLQESVFSSKNKEAVQPDYRFRPVQFHKWFIYTAKHSSVMRMDLQLQSCWDFNLHWRLIQWSPTWGSGT